MPHINEADDEGKRSLLMPCELCQNDAHDSKQRGNEIGCCHHELRHWLPLFLAANVFLLIGGYPITTLNRDQKTQIDDCKLKPTLTLTKNWPRTKSYGTVDEALFPVNTRWDYKNHSDVTIQSYYAESWEESIRRESIAIYHP
jgi:hypothetical protein